MKELRVGCAVCGSFCTIDRAIGAYEALAAQGGYALTPIFSETAYATDSRFGPAREFISRMEALCGRPVLHTVPEVEPIGPKALLDALIVAPCTGATLARLARGMTDSSVAMAVKAHLRAGRPVILAVSTNDGLSGSAENIAALLNRKNVYFVPFGQDDPVKKPCSLAADLSRLEETLLAALEGRQTQPVLVRG